MFSLRFDMRLPTPDAARAHYAAAIEMAAWAETRGGGFVVLSEHHGVPDGYLPSPALLAAAITARTSATYVLIAAALLPFADPVRLAEDIAVLDAISSGRVGWVFGLGYRREEYELFGVDFAQRGAIADEKLAAVLEALDGDAVTPHVAARPSLSWGGGTKAAARRAARFGLGFFGQTNADGLETTYREECARLGHEPGAVMLPSPGSPTSVFVADDVDGAWEEIGAYLLHDATAYAAWNDHSQTTASLSHGSTVDELRAEESAHRIYRVDEAVAIVRAGGMLSLHPMCGGIPADIAWKYLERVGREVEPAVTG